MQSRVCQICRKRQAKYVCQECGRTICEACLEPQTWACSVCYGRLEEESEAPRIFQSFLSKLFLLSFLLIFIGVIFIVISVVLLGTPASAGVVLVLGPIPIILGTGPYATLALVLAVILTILSIVMFFVFQKRMKTKP